MSLLISGKLVACDTECTGLNTWKGDRPFAFSFCNVDGSTAYIEWEVDPKTREVRVVHKDLKLMRDFFEDESIVKVFHHAKFDIRMLESIGIKVRGEIHDTMIAAHNFNNLEPSFGLKDLAWKYCGIDNGDENELKKAVQACRRKAKSLEFATGPSVAADYWMVQQFPEYKEACEKYATLDAVRTMALWIMYSSAFEEEDNWKTYKREMALWPVVYAMETRGVCLKEEYVRAERERNKVLAETLSQQLRDQVGREDFNPNSNKQLGEFLYGTLGLDIKKRSSSGAASTDSEALRHHISHPFVHAILNYRAAEKCVNNFYGQYLEEAVPDDFGRGLVLHPNFNQLGAATGRFSCRKPNLQNVGNADTSTSVAPIQARPSFGPRDGYVWLTADYSQLEVVLFADVSGEPTMIEAVRNGADIHSFVTNKTWGGFENPAAVRAAASSLELNMDEASSPLLNAVWEKYNWSPRNANSLSARRDICFNWLSEHNWDIVAAEKSIGKKVTRGRTKCMTFAKIYGGGAKSIMELLMCERREAEQFLRDYDAAFPFIKIWTEKFISEAGREGYISNKYGRRLHINQDKCYQAVNYAIQSAAADLLKEGMKKTYNYLKDTGLDAHLVMTLHDELMFEVRKEHLKNWLVRGLKILMEDHDGVFSVPLKAEFSLCEQDWGHKQAISL